MRPNRPFMLILLSATLFVLVFIGLQLEVPTVSAFSSWAFSNTASLTSNACATSGCHVASSSPGSASVTGLVSPYTPGVTQHLTVRVNDATSNQWGFLLTARLANNLGTHGGTLAAPNVDSAVYFQDIISENTGVSTWAVDWTPPASASAGDVNFYLSGLSINIPNTGTYQAMYTVKAPTAAATPNFSLSASPSTLTMGQGGSGSSTITITPSGGFNPSSVIFSPMGLPTGLSATFSPISSSGTSTLIFSASNTATAMTVGATITGTSGSLSNSTMVNLTVDPPASSSSLAAAPTSLTFNYSGATPSSQSLNVSDSSATVSYSASTSGGGSWLTVNPASGKTPSSVMVSVNPTGMSAGSYSGTVHLNATGATGKDVPVTLNVTTSGGGGGSGGSGGSTTSTLYAQPHVHDPSGWSSLLSAQWVDQVGEPTSTTIDPGLVLSMSAGAPTGSYAGAIIRNFTSSLTKVGFDFHTGGQCTDTSPRFNVRTTDYITHIVGGCSKGTITTTDVPAGWSRVRFDLLNTTQTSPVITPGEQVYSITLEMDTAGGLIVMDNIDINGTLAVRPPLSYGGN